MDLSVSDGDKEVLTFELINKDTKYILIICCYKPPKGDNDKLISYLDNIFNILFHFSILFNRSISFWVILTSIV